MFGQAIEVCLFEKEVSCMAAAGVRVKITLACTECKQRNYNTMIISAIILTVLK